MKNETRRIPSILIRDYIGQTDTDIITKRKLASDSKIRKGRFRQKNIRTQRRDTFSLGASFLAFFFFFFFFFFFSY